MIVHSHRRGTMYMKWAIRSEVVKKYTSIRRVQLDKTFNDLKARRASAM